MSFALPSFAQQTTADPQLREQLLTLAKKFEDAWNNNDAVALSTLFTEDAVLIEDSGPVYGREAIEKHYKDMFQNVHFSNNRTRYNDPNSNSPHSIGTAGNERYNTGEWSQTLQGQTGGPIQRKGYWGAIDTRQGNDWKILMLTPNVTPEPAPPAASAEAK